MDKQFLRFLMLSILLFAGANLAQAIDRNFIAAAIVPHSFFSRFGNSVSDEPVRMPSTEGKRFMNIITAEEHADLNRGNK